MGRCRDAGESTLGDVRRPSLDDHLGDGAWSQRSRRFGRCEAGRAIELHSDSEYLIYGMRVFVFRWQRQGWRNRRGNQLQHRELWAELIALNARLHIRWTWIKGHNGNRRTDAAPTQLAYQAARTLWVQQKAAA